MKLLEQLITLEAPTRNMFTVTDDHSLVFVELVQ
jgi:hypothetical protein